MDRRYWWIIGIFLFLVLVGFVLGPQPEDPVYTEEIPGLPGSPAQLEDYLEHYEASRSLRPDNEARIIWYNATARKTKYSFLYLHGFAGSYRDG